MIDLMKLNSLELNNIKLNMPEKYNLKWSNQELFNIEEMEKLDLQISELF